MNIFLPIKNFIINLNEKQFYKYFGIFLSILFVVLGILVYRHSSQITLLQKKIRRVNQQREEAQKILQQNLNVMQQQQSVNEILAQEPQFKIMQYFVQVINELNLKQFNTKEPGLNSDNIDNNYAEDKLVAGFSGIDMKQLCDLLNRIEKNERIYTKEITITKSLKTPTIDVILIIATLRERAS